MSERKINLEEILLKNIKKIYTELKPVEDFCNRDRIIAINAMKEACKQTLELAAENAETRHNYYDKWDENEAYNKHKEFGFERCDGDGIPYGVDVVTINKQSILNTIKQIE